MIGRIAPAGRGALTRSGTAAGRRQPSLRQIAAETRSDALIPDSLTFIVPDRGGSRSSE